MSQVDTRGASFMLRGLSGAQQLLVLTSCEQVTLQHKVWDLNPRCLAGHKGHLLVL